MSGSEAYKSLVIDPGSHETGRCGSRAATSFSEGVPVIFDGGRVKLRPLRVMASTRTVMLSDLKSTGSIGIALISV
jgi:hypothetical protein